MVPTAGPVRVFNIGFNADDKRSRLSICANVNATDKAVVIKLPLRRNIEPKVFKFISVALLA
jgi:hypothetical protein